MGYGAEGRSGLYNWSRRVQARAVGRVIARHVLPWDGPLPPKRRMCLEIGPGAGEMLPILARWGEVHTQDIEPVKPVNSTCHYCWPLPDVAGGPWDIVYAAHVLEHLATPAIVALSVSAIARSLRSGGLFVGVVPDYRRWGVDFWDVDATHGWPPTARRMCQVADCAGLAMEHLTLVTGPLAGRWAHVVSALWRMVPGRRLVPRVRQAGYSLNGDMLCVMRRP